MKQIVGSYRRLGCSWPGLLCRLEAAFALPTIIFNSAKAGADSILPVLLLRRQTPAGGGVPDQPEPSPQLFNQYGDYIDTFRVDDPRTGSNTVTRPNSTRWGENPFGDGCWRSAWLYASLLVIQKHDNKLYKEIVEHHSVSIANAEQFIIHFDQHCATDDGFANWRRHHTPFTRDQLCPLLYLLACIKKCDVSINAKRAAKRIVKKLSKHEEHGRDLSDTAEGKISRGLGFIIENLCDAFGVVYRFKRQKAFTDLAVPVAASNNLANVPIRLENARRRLLGKEPLPLLEDDPHKIARDWHRAYTRLFFEGALGMFNAGAVFEGSPVILGSYGGEEVKLSDLSDGYSVFNALAQLSTMRVLRGKLDKDCKAWRMILSMPAALNWGPAFRILFGSVFGLLPEDIDQYKTMYITKDHDNDIVLAQRPKKYMNGSFPVANVVATPETRLVLDYPILRALQLLWPGP